MCGRNYQTGGNKITYLNYEKFYIFILVMTNDPKIPSVSRGSHGRQESSLI